MTVGLPPGQGLPQEFFLHGLGRTMHLCKQLFRNTDLPNRDLIGILCTFAKDNKALVIKGGVMDGQPLSPTDLEKIADLESREVLLAKLAGALKGNQTKAAGLFNAPAAQLARLFGALQDKKN